MKNMMKKKDRGKFCILLIFLISMVTGCDVHKNQTSLEAGMEAVENQEYTEALDFFSIALEEKENEQLIYRGQGIAYMGLGQYEEAIESLLHAISFNQVGPDDVSFDMNEYLAVAYYKTKQYQKAIQIYDAIIALKPKDTQSYYLRGCVKMENQKTEEAVEDFDKAVSMEPADYDMCIGIYQCMEECGQKEQGEKYLKDAMGINGTVMSHYNQGRIYYYLENYDNARNELEEARSETPELMDIYLLLGQTYEKLGDCNYAASVYNDYLKNKGQSQILYNEMGLCKMQVKDYEGALGAFQAALQLEEHSMTQTLKYNEVVAYEYMEDFEQAASKMKAYISEYPEDEKALREYEFLKTR